MANQISKKISTLKRKWKKLKLKSSGPLYHEFKHNLEVTNFIIRLNDYDLGLESGVDIKQNNSKMKDLKIDT